jgi:hypothetical protein
MPAAALIPYRYINFVVRRARHFAIQAHNCYDGVSLTSPMDPGWIGGELDPKGMEMGLDPQTAAELAM